MSNEDRIPPIIPPRNDLDYYESELTRQLADLHREYMARAQPLLDALAYCRSLRPAPPIIDFIIIDDPLAKQEGPKC